MKNHAKLISFNGIHYKNYKDMAENGSGLDRCMVLSDFSGSIGNTNGSFCCTWNMIGNIFRNHGVINLSLLKAIHNCWKFQINLWRIKCYVLNTPWGGNTDFLAAIQLILDVGIKHRLSLMICQIN